MNIHLPNERSSDGPDTDMKVYRSECPLIFLKYIQLIGRSYNLHMRTEHQD